MQLILLVSQRSLDIQPPYNTVFCLPHIAISCSSTSGRDKVFEQLI